MSLKEVPNEKFTFAYTGQGAFAPSDKNDVRLTLYDGAVVKHWFWGNLAFDLKGMKLAKSRIPILEGHDTEARLGFAEKVTLDGGFILHGQLLANSPRAQAFKRDAQDGFPFEASLRMDSKTAKYREVKEGETVQVNGHTFSGPGHIFDSVEIKEGSVVTFGALTNTRAETFSDAEQFKAKEPLLYEQIFKQAQAELREAFQEIQLVCPDAEIAVKCWQDGSDPKEAQIAYLQAQLKGSHNIDPAIQEFSDKAKQINSNRNDLLEMAEGDASVVQEAAAKLNQLEQSGRINVVSNSKNAFLNRSLKQ
ncbi:MAG: hypothetical protein JXA82_17915 [Sedimentisphaerales bacterium]|nr:hypothetical protein [Sedimentisphaerales bacterium]